MKILRWILSHTFLILLIVVVIYGYMFWGNLLGKDTPAGKAVAYLSSEFVVVDEFVNAVKAKQEGLKTARNQDADDSTGQAAEQKADEGITAEESAVVAATQEAEDQETGREANSIDGTDAEITAVPDAQTTDTQSSDIQASGATETAESIAEDVDSESITTTDAAAGISAQGSIDPDVNNQGTIQRYPDQTSTDQTLDNKQGVEQSDVVADASTGSSEINSSAASMTAMDNAEAFVSPEIEKQLENVDDSGRVIDEAQMIAAVRDTWLTARKSFYQRKYELSEQSYQDVIKNTRDNHDAYGELGNVYFNQGKQKQAAAAYYEAAAILVKKGQVNRARSLVGLLRHLDEPKASELQQLIESAAS